MVRSLLWLSGSSRPESRPPLGTPTVTNTEFANYQRSILNRLGYFGISFTRIIARDSPSSVQHALTSITGFGHLICCILYLNTFVKSIFLAFLVMDYFGPVVFLDKIAALDYILCFGLVVLAVLIWFKRYPLYGKLEVQLYYKLIN